MQQGDSLIDEFVLQMQPLEEPIFFIPKEDRNAVAFLCRSQRFTERGQKVACVLDSAHHQLRIQYMRDSSSECKYLDFADMKLV